MRFDFLYDRRKRIFAIGYRLADADGPGRLDASFYDLLASEARLASFVAIAKGDVPQHHWFHLGRLVTNVDGRATLMSWGGTMFEYLMPLLLMRTFPGTLLDQSCRAEVRRQMEYGRQRGVPWGISESAYAFTDRDGNYQYRAFGVPGLGLKRGLADDLVIAPYATALAASSIPAAAAENFERLAEAASTGDSGSTRRSTTRPRNRDLDAAAGRGGAPGRSSTRSSPITRGCRWSRSPTSCCDDAFVSRFHADPRIQATELLLQERVPREAILSEPRPAESDDRAAVDARLRLAALPLAAHESPHTQFLSNGRYTAAPHERGRRVQHVARHGRHPPPRGSERPMPARTTSFCATRGPSTSGRRRTSPSCQEPDQFDATFELDKVTFRRRDGDFETQLQITVSSEDDVEVRRLTILNRGPRRARSKSPATRRWCWRARKTISRILRSASCSSRRNSTRRAPGSCSAAGRAAADESPIVGFHVLGVEGGGSAARSNGRRIVRASSAAAAARQSGGARRPRAVRDDGAVLDPIAALRERSDCRPAPLCASSLPPASRRTAPRRLRSRASPRTAAPPRGRSRWPSPTSTSRSSTSASSDDQAMLFDRLASRVFGSDSTLISPADLAANTLGQPNLWGFGISGDLPIVLVRVLDIESLPLVRQLLNAQEYWRVKGLRADLVILNEHPADYLDEAQQLLTQMMQELPWAGWLGKPGGMALLRTDGMADVNRRLLAAVARVVVPGDLGDLVPQLERPAPWQFDEDDVPPSAELRAPGPAAGRLCLSRSWS